jgi:hypothetical protein
VDNASIIYNRRLDVAPREELEMLAAVYSFALRTHQDKQRVDPAAAPDVKVRSDENSRAQSIMPKQS